MLSTLLLTLTLTLQTASADDPSTAIPATPVTPAPPAPAPAPPPTAPSPLANAPMVANYAQGMRTARRGVIVAVIGAPIWFAGDLIVVSSEQTFKSGLASVDLSDIFVGGGGYVGGSILDLSGAIMLDFGSAYMTGGSLRSATAIRHLGGHVSKFPGYLAWGFWGTSLAADLSSVKLAGGNSFGNLMMAGAYATATIQMIDDRRAWRKQLLEPRAVELEQRERPSVEVALSPIIQHDGTEIGLVGTF